LLLDADRKLAAAACALSCNVDSVGVADSAAVYIGLMPETGVAPDPSGRASAPALLRSQLGPLMERREDLHPVLDRVPRQFLHSDTIITTLAGLLRAS
jgi:hypothetical protein